MQPLACVIPVRVLTTSKEPMPIYINRIARPTWQWWVYFHYNPGNAQPV